MTNLVLSTICFALCAASCAMLLLIGTAQKDIIMIFYACLLGGYSTHRIALTLEIYINWRKK